MFIISLFNQVRVYIHLIAWAIPLLPCIAISVSEYAVQQQQIINITIVQSEVNYRSTEKAELKLVKGIKCHQKHSHCLRRIRHHR